MRPNKIFHSPSQGQLTFSQLTQELVKSIKNEPRESYRIIIGTDSNGRGGEFVTAVILHRIGKGGWYWWTKSRQNHFFPLQARIYQEAHLSIELAEELIGRLKRYLGSLYGGEGMPELEIHTDIGQKGATRDLIKEVVGMIQGNGLKAKVKPEAFGASVVADRHT